MKRTVFIGQVFFRLTVVREGPVLINEKHKTRALSFYCRCSCGKEILVRKSALFGNTKSCGCYASEINKPFGFKFSYPELYRKYKHAKVRCNNPNATNYHHYGGRGIQFRFNNGFVDFVKYCLEIGWKPGLQIDRIDNNGHYEKGNIRFVTAKQNNRNKRTSKSLTIFGETKNIYDWSEDPRCVVGRRTFISRITHGWAPDKALLVPLHQHVKFY